MVFNHNDGFENEANRLRKFWNDRYHEFSLKESGIKSLSASYSELLYQCKREAYEKAIRLKRINTGQPIKILDAGCGQGYFAEQAVNIFPNVNYTGVDISQKAIDYLRSKWPQQRWICENFCTSNFMPQESFDIIQSIEVLHLILDDGNHKQALINFGKHLQSKGMLVLTDGLPKVRTQINDYIVFRPLGCYQEISQELNLEITDIYPMYYWVPDRGMRIWPLKYLFRGLPPYVVFKLDRIFLKLHVPQFRQSHDCAMKMIVMSNKS